MKIINTPKDLPAVHTLIEDKKLSNLIGNYGAQLVTKCAKNVLSGARKQVLIGNPTNYEKIIETLEEDNAIRFLVLAAADSDQPGPLVSLLAGQKRRQIWTVAG